MKLSLLAGAAAGYVLGTRAGRERYASIVSATRRIRGSQGVQSAAGTLRAKVDQATGAARGRVPSSINDRFSGRHTQGSGAPTNPAG